MKHRPILDRSFPLLDIEVERGGDGRTVTAYAATFGDPYEVRDQFGHYLESINPTAFNMAIGRGIEQVSVFYNHGRTIDGKSAAEFSIPLGVPTAIRAEAKGLLTVTRYNKTDLADQILEAIRSGSVWAQSFRGPIYATAPDQIVRGSALPLKERTQLGLMEYGPTPMPVNAGAEMVSVRSITELLTIDPAELSDDERAALLAALSPTPSTLTQPSPTGDSGDTSDPETPPPVVVDPASDPTHLAQAQRRRRSL